MYNITLCYTTIKVFKNNLVDENYYIKPYKDYISNNTTLLFIKIENECV